MFSHYLSAFALKILLIELVYLFTEFIVSGYLIK